MSFDMEPDFECKDCWEYEYAKELDFLNEENKRLGKLINDFTGKLHTASYELDALEKENKRHRVLRKAILMADGWLNGKSRWLKDIWQDGLDVINGDNNAQ